MESNGYKQLEGAMPPLTYDTQPDMGADSNLTDLGEGFDGVVETDFNFDPPLADDHTNEPSLPSNTSMLPLTAALAASVVAPETTPPMVSDGQAPAASQPQEATDSAPEITENISLPAEEQPPTAPSENIAALEVAPLRAEVSRASVYTGEILPRSPVEAYRKALVETGRLVLIGEAEEVDRQLSAATRDFLAAAAASGDKHDVAMTLHGSGSPSELATPPEDGAYNVHTANVVGEGSPLTSLESEDFAQALAEALCNGDPQAANAFSAIIDPIAEIIGREHADPTSGMKVREPLSLRQLRDACALLSGEAPGILPGMHDGYPSLGDSVVTQIKQRFAKGIAEADAPYIQALRRALQTHIPPKASALWVPATEGAERPTLLNFTVSPDAYGRKAEVQRNLLAHAALPHLASLANSPYGDGKIGLLAVKDLQKLPPDVVLEYQELCRRKGILFVGTVGKVGELNNKLVSAVGGAPMVLVGELERAQAALVSNAARIVERTTVSGVSINVQGSFGEQESDSKGNNIQGGFQTSEGNRGEVRGVNTGGGYSFNLSKTVAPGPQITEEEAQGLAPREVAVVGAGVQQQYDVVTDRPLGPFPPPKDKDTLGIETTARNMEATIAAVTGQLALGAQVLQRPEALPEGSTPDPSVSRLPAVLPSKPPLVPPPVSPPSSSRVGSYLGPAEPQAPVAPSGAQAYTEAMLRFTRDRKQPAIGKLGRPHPDFAKYCYKVAVEATGTTDPDVLTRWSANSQFAKLVQRALKDQARDAERRDEAGMPPLAWTDLRGTLRDLWRSPDDIADAE